MDWGNPDQTNWSMVRLRTIAGNFVIIVVIIVIIIIIIIIIINIIIIENSLSQGSWSLFFCWLRTTISCLGKLRNTPFLFSIPPFFFFFFLLLLLLLL